MNEMPKRDDSHPDACTCGWPVSEAADCEVIDCPSRADPAGPLTESEAARLREILGVGPKPEDDARHSAGGYLWIVERWTAAQNTDALLAFAAVQGWFVRFDGPHGEEGAPFRWWAEVHAGPEPAYGEGTTPEAAVGRAVLAATEGERR